MGANQFDKPQDHAIYFNRYFIAGYSSKVISATAIVYIEDNVSWRLGFGLCIAANLAALVILLAGTRLYRHDKPQGSAFIGLVRVVVAAARKRKAMLSSRIEDYHQQEQNDEMIKIEAVTPKQNFRFLNRAALKIEGDIRPDGSIAKPWKLCTIQQVEDLKALIRILPIWSTIIFLATPIGILNNLVILQALTMDRHLGHNFKIPTGSFPVICMISGFIFVSLKDRLLRPTWQKIIHRSPTPLQLVGIGYMLSMISMVVSALVESKRLKITHNVHHQQPMSALWLFPQLILLGIGEAFHSPGQAAFYYQEFPASLKSTSAAMIGMMIGICYYLNTALIDLVRRFTDWLPDNINSGRLDNVYWTLAVLAGINFGYYLLCSIMYKYKDGGGSGSDDN
ncbi:hypothetical protein Q3G72_026668 [Acer saccharum]|nr:hypothetical protein Q3G72_003515 [Acer saccharum]KAK1588751.1 hypothetical protein Q3G72_026668 [Acer saccharum]